MPVVNLSDTEWQQVLGIIATAPWRDANPLLMKIGAQLKTQQDQVEIKKPDLHDQDGPHNPAAH